VLLITIFFLFRYCSSNKKEEKVTDVKPAPLTINENSGPFTQSFTRLLDSYYSLKDALVASDTVKANAASLQLALNADSLKTADIQGDTSGMIRETAQSFAMTISGSARALPAENGIENKRKELNMITDALWSLTRTVRYDGQKVYYQFCPMAFDNSGAYWLSDNNEIRNPYFGSKMLTCGEVTDSLDYSKK
jgi:Cu(I)/Ag(I) efflux system membrane fusion protein